MSKTLRTLRVLLSIATLSLTGFSYEGSSLKQSSKIVYSSEGMDSVMRGKSSWEILSDWQIERKGEFIARNREFIISDVNKDSMLTGNEIENYTSKKCLITDLDKEIKMSEENYPLTDDEFNSRLEAHRNYCQRRDNLISKTFAGMILGGVLFYSALASPNKLYTEIAGYGGFATLATSAVIGARKIKKEAHKADRKILGCER